MKRFIVWTRRLLRFPNPGELWVIHRDLLGPEFEDLYSEVGEIMVMLERQTRGASYFGWGLPGYTVMKGSGNIEWYSEFCIRYTAKPLVSIGLNEI